MWDRRNALDRRADLSVKRADYFRVPSIAHYLIVDPEKPRISHHARGATDVIVTRIVSKGAIRLDPPGLEIHCADIFSE